MTRSEALADLAASIDGGEHGDTHTIDGRSVACVVRNLRQEEAQSFADEGLVSKGLRVTAPSASMAYVPRFGTELEFDGEIYTVRAVQTIGVLLRFVLVRFQL